MTLPGTRDIASLLAGVPNGLRNPLLKEYNSILRNYREKKWVAAGVNGGRFAEIVYTILRGLVDGNFPSKPSKPANMVDACRAFERESNQPRSIRIQLPKMLIALYEIRNNRDVGHVGGEVDSNYMDATVIVAISKWVLAELIRILHGTTTDEATLAIESLTQRTIPILWNIGDKVRVLNPKLSARDKTLVVLYGLGKRVKASELCRILEYSNAARYRKSVLTGAHKEALIDFDTKDDTAELSPLGVRRVEEEIELEV